MSCETCKVVYVVTNADYGWDCVVGVFDANTITMEKIELTFPQKSGYFIFEKIVETATLDYE